MIITEYGPIDDAAMVKNTTMVEITAAEYAHLVKLAERYEVIKGLAFKKAELNWKNELDLYGEDVCEYIKFVEQEKVADEERRLRAIKKEQETRKKEQEASK